MPPEPKSSTARMTEATGQLTAPQKSATSPTAAAKPAGMPRSGPRTQPSVAPMKKVGTTSPPRKPQPSVTAVKRSFSAKARGSASPAVTAREMTAVPAPL